jgi:hypothetical protein
MTRGKIVAATLGIAGVGLMALGLGSTPASADPYCGPGYHWAAGYCYPNAPVYRYPPRVAYYPAYPAPVYYPAPAPVVVAPAIGFSFGFGGGHFHR